MPSTSDSLHACAETLRCGLPVIIPTDTVYGIAALALNEDAVARLYDAKGKERSAPLQLLFGPDLGAIGQFAILTAPARKLIDVLGPGGWTVIVPAAPGWQSIALAGGSSVGVRIPDAPVVHNLVAAVGQPLAASSANRHGGPSPRTCEEAVAQLGASCGYAIDAGPTAAGLDSTIIDFTGAQLRIIREGAIDRHRVARILGESNIPVLRSIRL